MITQKHLKVAQIVEFICLTGIFLFAAFYRDYNVLFWVSVFCILELIGSGFFIMYLWSKNLITTPTRFNAMEQDETFEEYDFYDHEDEEKLDLKNDN